MRVLITAEQIQQRIDELAADVARLYRQEDKVTVVGVLTGSLIFLADLVRRLDLRLRIGLVRASSYRGATTTASELHISTDLLPDIRNRHVLLLDDILDTGKTITRLVPALETFGPASLRTAVLLHKQGRQVVPFEPDFVGFRIPDEFVIGYGLDFNDEYRHLPFIGVLDNDEAKSGSAG